MSSEAIRESVAGSGAEGRQVPFGMLAYAGAGASLAICFSKVIAAYALAVLGVEASGLELNPHLQAILMWLFALIGVFGLVRDRSDCGSSIPVWLGAASFLVIVGTLYGPYSVTVLMMGYTVLLVAAFLNQTFRLRQLNEQVAEQAHSLRALNERCTKLDYELGFGVGIASGYATIGIVGYEGRYDYTANGTAVNLAARLCDAAGDGQVLIARRAWVEIEDEGEARPIDGLQLKGVSDAEVVYEIVRLKASATAPGGEGADAGESSPGEAAAHVPRVSNPGTFP